MPRSSDRLSIRLLGPLEVSVGDRPIIVDTRKALAIVALVAAEGRPFARDELAAMFWPDAGDEAARGALRRTLSSLRSAVAGRGLILERTQVAIDPLSASVDLLEFERLAGSTMAADLEAAVALARGPFMAGFGLRDSPPFDDWQAARGTRVERTLGRLLDRLADARLAAGDRAAAVEAARRRVEVDPLDEAGQRRLIDLLARSGDRAAAIRQYRSLVALFDRELGVPPLPETSRLYDAVRDDQGGTGPAGDRPGSPEVAGTPPASATQLPLVGRDEELELIVATAAAATRDGRLVIIQGEAGIGKTRLAEAAATAILARGGKVLASRGYPGEAGIAYGPISGLLRSGLSETGGPARLAILDQIALQELGRLIDLPGALRTGRADSRDSPRARVRLLDAIADGLTALVGGSTPGLVWIDDLHHADRATRQALMFLARRLAGRPLVLLVAWRREDLSIDGVAAAAELARIPAVVEVSLGRLDRTAIATLIRAARPAGTEDDGPLDEATIDAVANDSEGLPLHVIEALAIGRPAVEVVQRDVQELLHERIASVGGMAGQVMAAAAVIGRSFDLETLRSASGRSEEETISAVEELVRRGIVREIGGPASGPIGYDFSHGRLRETAYSATSLGRRRLLHRRTAAALRSIAAGPRGDDLATFALIAGHERQAGRTVEAAEAYRVAADRAQAVFANREAIDALEAALALGHPGAVELRVRIGELRARLGEYPAAIADLETAAALADPGQLAAIESTLGRVHRRRGDLSAAASHLDAALETTGLAPALRVRTLVERSTVAIQVDDLVRAGSAAEEARVIAGSMADPHAAGVAERLVGLVARARGDLATARAAFERSARIAADDPDPTAAVAAMTALGLATAAGGEVDAALEAINRALVACRRIGDRHLEAAVENHLADVLHGAGRDDDAMNHLKRAVALFAEIGEGEPEPQSPGIWTLAAW